MNEDKKYTQDQLNIALITEKLSNIEKRVGSIDNKLEKEYVTKSQLMMVETQLSIIQRIVYGLVGLILTAVVGGMVAFYINAPK